MALRIEKQKRKPGSKLNETYVYNEGDEHPVAIITKFPNTRTYTHPFKVFLRSGTIMNSIPLVDAYSACFWTDQHAPARTMDHVVPEFFGGMTAAVSWIEEKVNGQAN